MGFVPAARLSTTRPQLSSSEVSRSTKCSYVISGLRKTTRSAVFLFIMKTSLKLLVSLTANISQLDVGPSEFRPLENLHFETLALWDVRPSGSWTFDVRPKGC